ncbi:hypothetical protein EV360DRAFT_82289 [Lentinula raphanica]|nr:hypothetical protein EV360DRAFT_82289 [Lentinula raphanica]
MFLTLRFMQIPQKFSVLQMQMHNSINGASNNSNNNGVGLGWRPISEMNRLTIGNDDYLLVDSELATLMSFERSTASTGSTTASTASASTNSTGSTAASVSTTTTGTGTNDYVHRQHPRYGDYCQSPDCLVVLTPTPNAFSNA